MSLRAAYCRYDLIFKEPATTSRETMSHKETFFIKLWHDNHGDGAAGALNNLDVYGLGECALFRGLSSDDTPDYESRLAELCSTINATGTIPPIDASSMRFGLESALKDLENGGKRLPFPSAWTEGKSEILINGLIWMGNIAQMKERLQQKLAQGFRCIKFKIGGQDFDQEYELIRQIRSIHGPGELELRLDANGAFTPDNALARLDRLSALEIHSIEQPIKPRQWEVMAQLCKESPIPIALDEELIGINSIIDKEALIRQVKPQYIILKPSLCGGLSGAQQWIDIADRYHCGWWVTSALESNIGLNTLAQWVATLSVTMPQGLGTGNLYVNNIASPICQKGCGLQYDTSLKWQIPQLQWIDC